MQSAASACRRATVFLLALACSLGCAAQSTASAEGLRPAFQPVASGAIPRAVVAAIAQDRAGFIWIATGDGLMRHDGYRLRPQEREAQDPARRNLGWIRTLLATRDGRLWIGTETDGLAVYDPHSDRMLDFPAVLAPSLAAPDDAAPRPTLRALAEDAEGGLWVGSMGGGLEHIDPASGRRTVWRAGTGPGSLPDDRVLALAVGRDGGLWVGTWAGLVRRAPGQTGFEPVFGGGAPGTGPGGAVQALLEDADGRLWAGTQQGDLARVDPAGGAVQWLAGPAAGTGPGAAVTALAQVAPDRIWVARMQGIDLHDAVSGRLKTRLRHDPRDTSGLAGNEVSALLVDQAGWVWVGGYGLGLQRHNPQPQALWLRGADTAPGSPFVHPSARSLLALDNGEVWVGTADAGVVVMDKQWQVRAAFHPGAAGPGPPAARIEAMVQMPDGSVWLAADAWLLQLDRQRRMLRRLHHGAGDTHRLVAGTDGSLWVCTQDGLYRLRPGAGVLERVGLGADAPLRGHVFAVAEAADGDVWVGAVGGLYRMAAGSTALHAVAARPDAALGSPVVLALLFDAQRRLWLDTAVAGLHRMVDWDGHQAGFDRVSVRHGLAGRPFGANLALDGRGRLWTQQHVYDPAHDRIDELTAADGQLLVTGWFFSHARLADGRLLFGGSRGVLVVAPEQFEPAADLPALVVTELRAGGRRMPAGPRPAALQLSPAQRSFSVEFAALEYAEPGRVRYAWRLQGLDDDWLVGTADQRVASYANLPPGRYLLQLRASNRSGLWGEQTLELPVQVLPAWWQQRWLQALALLLAAALMVAAVQVRTRRLRQRKQALEQTVQQRTAELERLAQALARESAALQDSSLTDPLTGLRNRRFLAQHVEADVALSVRRWQAHVLQGGAPPDDADLLLFLVDIDHFKQVNDRHGHAAGDAVLQQMRGRLQHVFRDSDHIVRWGGEEFLIVARGSPRAHAAELAERARQAVAREPFTLADGMTLHCTCSVGFACFPLAPRQPRALGWDPTLALADAALYLAKSRGRDAWSGVLDAGRVDAAELQQRRPATEWLDSGRLTLLHSPPAGR